MTKDELITLVQFYANSSDSLDVKRALGSGDDFQLRGETVSPGIAYITPSSIDVLLEAIASAINGDTVSTIGRVFEDFHEFNQTVVELPAQSPAPILTKWLVERSATTENGHAEVALMPGQLFPADEYGAGILMVQTIESDCEVTVMDGTPTFNGAHQITFEARVRMADSLTNNTFEIGLMGVDGYAFIRKDTNGNWSARIANSSGSESASFSPSPGITANTWVTFQIVFEDTLTRFYANNRLENLFTYRPDKSTSLGRYIYAKDNSVATVHDYIWLLDYMIIDYTRLTATTGGAADPWADPHIQY